MILDTNFLIDIIRGDESATQKLKELNKRGISYSITSISIFELFGGIMLAKKPVQEKEKVMEILKSQIIHSLNSKDAELAGEINGNLIKKGKRIDSEDCMIAGIAKARNEPILTKDKHFDLVESLDIQVY